MTTPRIRLFGTEVTCDRGVSQLNFSNWVGKKSGLLIPSGSDKMHY